jgi:hypothetical protein
MVVGLQRPFSFLFLSERKITERNITERNITERNITLLYERNITLLLNNSHWRMCA